MYIYIYIHVLIILYRFELVPAVKGEVPRKELEIILRAKDGIHMKLIPRNLSH